MTFAYAWVLHFLWLLPVVGAALFAYHRRRSTVLTRFAEPELLQRLTGAVVPGMRAVKSALLLAALGLMIVALAGPRWGSHYQEVTQKGVDIVILADVSPSMLVEDVKPNRLERARREILDFLRVVQGDRVALVAFSGAAYVQCPLTLDYAALEMFLQSLNPELISTVGTDLGAAIETGVSAFDPKSETDKVMLLITDGEDNEGKGLDAARKAAGKGVKIFVFGVGDASGGPVPGGPGGFKKDDAGRTVLSRMDEGSLQKIAAETGGTYVRSVAGDLDLDVLYFNGIRSRTTAQTLKSGKIRIEEERFVFFLLPALLLLLIEGFLPERRRFRPTVLMVPLLLGSLLVADRARAENPDELYRAGRYKEAEKAYAELDMDHPKDIRYRYDRGCAAYQAGDYQGAIAAFSSAGLRADDNDMRFKAAYNLANAEFQKGDFAAAADLYRDALRRSPASADARHNLELALRKLEQQKQEQKKQEQQQKDQKKQKKDAADQKDGGKGDGQRNQPADTSPGEKKDDGEKNQEQGAQDQKQDQPGELKPLQDLPDNALKNEPRNPAASSADRKMAEALLNNVNEDRSHLRQPGAIRRRSVRSGKDW
jgi:Ca-activated chloride channel family protein